MIDILKLKTDKRKLLIPGISLAIILILVFVVYLPLIHRLIQTKNQVILKEKEISELQSQTQILSVKRKRKLPSLKEVSLAIDELSKLGADNKIDFVSIDPRQTQIVSSMPYQILPIDMVVESEYDDLGRFLGALENLKQSLVTLERLQIQRDEKILPRLRIKLTVNMYLGKD